MVYTIITRSQKAKCKFNNVMDEIRFIFNALPQLCLDEGTGYQNKFRKLFTKEPYAWKKECSKHEFYAWCEVEWDTVGLSPTLIGTTSGLSVADKEIIDKWCSENGHQIRDDGVYVWDLN